MLELAEPEECMFKLLLSDDNGLVEVSPPLVDLSQGLFDSSGLIRRSSLCEVVSLPKLEY